jgi:hypothetical protein
MYLVGAHASRLRWARECGLFTETEVASIAAQLDAALLTQLELAKGKRNWRSYWSIRNYLAAKRPHLRGHPELQERIAPRWTYTVKDGLDRLKSRAQRTVHG